MHKPFFAALMATIILVPISVQADSSYVKFSAGRSEYKGDDGKVHDNAISLAYGFAVDKILMLSLVTLILARQGRRVPVILFLRSVRRFTFLGWGRCP